MFTLQAFLSDLAKEICDGLALEDEDDESLHHLIDLFHNFEASGRLCTPSCVIHVLAQVGLILAVELLAVITLVDHVQLVKEVVLHIRCNHVLV